MTHIIQAPLLAQINLSTKIQAPYSLVMSTAIKSDEWEKIVDTTYRVVSEINGRGKSFHLTIANVLKIAAQYQVGSYLGMICIIK